MNEGNCIFCRIASGASPARKVYEDEDVFAFHDIHPQAPVHILIIPKKHLASLEETEEADQALLGKLLYVARNIARDFELHRNGYRLVLNTGRQGGQTVFHLHFHLLGGRYLYWPPG